MIFTETKLKGAFILDIERREDSRGFFARAFCQHEFEAHGLKPLIAQANIAFNQKRAPSAACIFSFRLSAETKLVRCTRGAILDIIVDLRPESPTFLEHIAVELSEDNYSRPLCARAFRSRLSGASRQHRNQLSGREFYTPGCEGGLLYNDPQTWSDMAATRHSDLRQGPMETLE